MNDITIVIPMYNQWAMTHQLLMDIYKNVPDVNVIVVNDCSTEPEVRVGLNWWKTSLFKERLEFYTNEENVGFLRSCNFGVSKSKTPITVLMNNDVRIYDKQFAQKIKNELQGNFTLVGARLLDGNTGWNTFGLKTFPYLEGWLVGFWTADWRLVEGFDERYIPFDFEDVDLSTTFLDRGGKLVQIDLDVVHLGAQSIKYSAEREQQTIRNQEKFKQKWVTNTKN